MLMQPLARQKRIIPLCFAARAAGQAVATAHVPQHAFGSAYYALKVAAANNSKIAKELNWQSKYLPKHLRKDWKDWQSKHLQKSLRKNNNFLNFIFINSFISFL